MISESRLISSVINNADIAPVINSANVDDLFTSHKDIWDFVKDYWYKYKAVAPKDIVEERFNEFEVYETPGNVKHYLDELRDDYQRGLLRRIAKGLAQDLDKMSTTEAIKAVESFMSDITKSSSNIKDLDITDHAKAVDYYTETKRLIDENGGCLGIRFGYDSIDANYPTGAAPGQYIMVLSRTAQGKSWLALDFAINAWAQGKKVLYVSLEMTPSVVRDRAYTLMSKGDFRMSDLSRALIDLNQMSKWSEANFENNKTKFIVTAADGMGGFSPNNLQTKIDQYSPDIVFVDYIQLMDDNKGSNGETDRVRSVSRELKALAMSSDIPIVAIAAASSNETKEYNSPPQIYEVAQSRQSAFDCDLVLALISLKQHDGTSITEVVSRKNRLGPDFDFILKMDVNNGRIEEHWAPGLIDPDESDE